MTYSEQVIAFTDGNGYFEGEMIKQGTDVFVPVNHTYPHIHMTKNFVVYSKNANNHQYLIQGTEVFKNRAQNIMAGSNSAAVIQICRYINSQL